MIFDGQMRNVFLTFYIWLVGSHQFQGKNRSLTDSKTLPSHRLELPGESHFLNRFLRLWRFPSGIHAVRSIYNNCSLARAFPVGF